MTRLPSLLTAGAIASAALFALPVVAQTQPGATAIGTAASAPGRASAAVVAKAWASVTAVDKATRAVTLKGPQGNEFTVVAGPEVRNFEQIKVGDDLVVTYAEALTLELKKGGGATRQRIESDDAARTKAGERPGVAATQTITVVADVVAVNPRTQTVTLKGPQRTVDLRVPDKKQFQGIKVGDQVEARYTEAVAVTMEPPPAKK